MSVDLTTTWEEPLADLGKLSSEPGWQLDVDELFSRLHRGADAL